MPCKQVLGWKCARVAKSDSNADNLAASSTFLIALLLHALNLHFYVTDFTGRTTRLIKPCWCPDEGEWEQAASSFEDAGLVQSSISRITGAGRPITRRRRPAPASSRIPSSRGGPVTAAAAAAAVGRPGPAAAAARRRAASGRGGAPTIAAVTIVITAPRRPAK